MEKRMIESYEIDGFVGTVVKVDNYIVPNKYTGFIRATEVILQGKDDPGSFTILRQSTNNNNNIVGENLLLAAVGDTIEITKRDDGLLELEIYSE